MRQFSSKKHSPIAISEHYIPPEINEDSLFDHAANTGINFDKYEHVQVQIQGPAGHAGPIENFDQMGLRSVLLSNLSRANYTKATPVQKNAIPVILSGRDMIASAATGSGKTAAFLLPIIHRLLEDGIEPHMGLPQTPEVLVISPTRELALQISKEAKKFAKGSNLGTFTVYGGASVSYQKDKLHENNINILVATPGRLCHFIKDAIISLLNVRFLVIDEADRMLEMGFRDDIDYIIKHQTMPPKSSRQTLMFSATFPPEVQTAAKTYLKEDYLKLSVGLLGAACSDVVQSVHEVDAFDKREKLLEILGASQDQVEKTIVFVEKKQQADFLASFLSQNEFKATSIHGDRFQSQREEAAEDFIKGRMNIIVATAVFARGIDVPNVAHVINYDLPKCINDYVHRIGRSGRIGNTGRATSFYDRNVDLQLTLGLVEKMQEAQQQVPDWLLEIARDAPGTNFGGNFDLTEFKPVTDDDNLLGTPGQKGMAQSKLNDVEEDWDWSEMCDMIQSDLLICGLVIRGLVLVALNSQSKGENFKSQGFF